MCYLYISRITDDDTSIVSTSKMLEAWCDIDRITDDGSIHTFICSYSSKSDLSPIDTDTDSYLTTDSANLKFFDKILDLYSCCESIIRFILIKYYEDAISEIFIDISTISVDNLANSIKVYIEKQECMIRIMYLFTHGRESHNIEKHDRQSLTDSCTKNHTFISLKSDFIMDFFRDKFFEYSLKFTIVFFEKILFDISTFYKGEEFCIFIELFFLRKDNFSSFIPHENWEICKDFFMLFPVFRIQKYKIP